MKSRALTAVIAIAIALAACSKPKAGDSCEKGKATCLDPRTELECQAGKFIAAPCHGPNGCAVKGGVQTCDVSTNAAGDVCSTDDEDVSQCTADKKARVVCKKGKYAIEPCKGPRGCAEQGDRVECDATLADEGDACSAPADEAYYACSVDKTKSLVCKDGKLVLDEICRGPNGCDATGTELKCDRGPQNVGDPCAVDGDYDCSADGKTLIACKQRKWAVERTCKSACTVTESTADCAD